MFEQGFSFEQWVVTPADRVVSGPYGETKLEPRVMDVFVHLAARAGQVVDRHSLIDTVWGGAVVGDEVLSRCIYQIRRALGESSRKAFHLETVPKHGYRLNATVVDLAEEAELAATVGRWREGSPFRGLHSFHLQHAAVFFGRATATQEAITALRGQASLGKNFLLLLGASGVGKSSLARAGILRNLTRSNVIKEVRRWHHDVFQPGDNQDGPLASLADALQRALNDTAATPITASNLAQIRHAEFTSALLANLPDDEAVALVVDQLEEVFSAEMISNDERQRFFDVLEWLASTGRCWIIATLRSDYYPYCGTYPALIRLKKGGGQYDVRPMRAEELGQTIRLPARAAGLSFERSSETGRTLDEVLHETAIAEPRLLPLLEFTLQALYDARNDDGQLQFAAYKTLGGIEGSVAYRAEESFNSLPTHQQGALSHVLARLVSVSGDRVRKTSRLLEEFPGSDSRALINAFVDARLFSIELDGAGEPRVDIAHEALLQNWSHAKNWIAENREMLLVKERVADAHERWRLEQRRDDLLLPRGRSLDEATALAQTAGIALTDGEQDYIQRSESRAGRRRWLERAAASSLMLLLVIAVVAAWQASEQRDFALQQTVIAEREAETSRETADFLVGIFDAADPIATAGGEMTAQRILDLGAARLEDELADQALLRGRLRTSVGRAYKGLGLYDEAEAMLRQAITEAESDENLTPRERLRIQFELADILFQRGAAGESELLHAQVRQERMQRFGAQDLDTVESQKIFAHELWRNGDVGNAASLLDTVLSQYQQQLGDNDPDTVDILSSMGTLYFLQGLRDDAKRYYREAANRSPAAYGDISISNAISISNLSLVIDDPRERESLLSRSLDIRKTILGENHHLVARAEEILANFYAEQGQSTKADSLYRQAIGKIAASTELTLVLPRVRQNYGNFLLDMQRYEDAIEAFSAARAENASQVGNEHRLTAISVERLAYAKHLSGNSPAAIELLREEIQRRNVSDEADRYVLAAVQRTLAGILVENGQYDEAAARAESAIKIFSIDESRHRIAMASAWSVLTEVALARRDPSAATTAAQRTLALADGDRPSNIAKYLALAGRAQVAAGNCKAGLALLNETQVVSPQYQAAPTDFVRLQTALVQEIERCNQ